VNVASAFPEVVLVEHEVLREVAALAEHEPTDPWIHQSELVAGDVDRAHLLQPEVPGCVREHERPEEPAARRVYAERHVEPAVVFEVHEQRVDPRDVVGMAGKRRAEHGRDPDCVLVHVGLDVVWADRVLVRGQGNDPGLDVEIAAELLPDDVDVAAEHEVGAVGGLAGGLAALAPFPLQRQGAQDDRLRRALSARAGRLTGGVEQVGDHPDASLLDHRRLRILGVVDEVAMEVLGDQPVGRCRTAPRWSLASRSSGSGSSVGLDQRSSRPCVRPSSPRSGDGRTGERA
jgi:hypothetical protein